MKKTITCLIIFLFATFIFSAGNLSAQPSQGTKEGEVYRVQNYIAVMDLTLGKGVDPELRVLLTNGLINELVKIGRYTVIDRANRNKILEEQGFQLKDCVEESCRVQVGRLLGVGKIVAGSLNKVGNTYFGMVQLVNVETGRIEVSADERGECRPEELLDLVGVLAGKLMGLPVSFSPKNKAATTGEALAPSQKTPEEKGGLYIKTNPPGAVVILNGKPAGESPLTMANLPVGSYQIEARKGNYYAREESEVVADQFSNVTVTMTLMKSRLTVITEPPEAKIYLDGQEVGKSPITLTEVAVGDHHLEAEKSGYLKTGKDILISKTDEMITISLIPGGTIKVRSDPPGADLEIGGKSVGSADLDYLVPPGKYKLKVSAPDYEPFESEVQVQAGETKAVEARLKPNFGYLSVSAKPGAEGIWLDGRKIGTNWISKEKVIFGKHQVEVRGSKPYQSQVFDVEIGRGEEKRLDVILNYKPEYISSIKGKRKAADIASISGAGLVLAGTTLAVVFGLRADSSYDSYKRATVVSDLDRFKSDTESNRNIEYIGIGVAGAGVVTALIALFARPKMPEETKSSMVPKFEGSSIGAGLCMKWKF